MVESFISVLKGVFSYFGTSSTTYVFMLMDTFLGTTNQGFASSWENPIIQSFLYICSTFSWIIFACFLPMYFLKIAQEKQRDWHTIFMCPITAIIFIVFNQIIVQICLLIPDIVINLIGSVMKIGMPSDMASGFKTLTLGNVIVIVTIIAFLCFLYITIMRFGAMVIQVMIAPFYLPFIITGDNQKASEWLLSTVAIGFTYLIQYLLFYGGFLLLSFTADIPSQIIAFSLMFSTLKVPGQMQKFGWSSGGGGSLNSAYMGANMISSLMRPK